LTLLSEDRPVDNEVKSEAAFQRLVASGTELPAQPRTPGPTPNRGRYPEEAVQDDFDDRETSPSDDDLELDEAFMPPPPPSSTEPISIRRPRSGMGYDMSLISASESSSFSGAPMDIDMVSRRPCLLVKHY